MKPSFFFFDAKQVKEGRFSREEEGLRFSKARLQWRDERELERERAEAELAIDGIQLFACFVSHQFSLICFSSLVQPFNSIKFFIETKIHKIIEIQSFINPNFEIFDPKYPLITLKKYKLNTRKN